MTADVILLTEAQVLTDDIRRDSVIWLARQCTEIPYEALAVMLARWSHKSLSPERRAGLFEVYRRSAEAASALAGGVAVVSEFFDDGDLPPLGGDISDLAIELLGDRADEALFALINGETER